MLRRIWRALGLQLLILGGSTSRCREEAGGRGRKGLLPTGFEDGGQTLFGFVAGSAALADTGDYPSQARSPCARVRGMSRLHIKGVASWWGGSPCRIPLRAPFRRRPAHVWRDHRGPGPCVRVPSGYRLFDRIG